MTELPAPSGLNKDHHGPPTSGSWLPWSSGAKSSDQPSRPKSFQNPWPSWRSPTLSDAYRAYKLGAALAHPEPRQPGLSREQSRTEDHPAYDPYKLSDGQDVPKLPYDGWYPVSTYVRPPLAEKYEDDEDDDWREPPVKVVTPGWGGMDQGKDKEVVTWLGHATVLVQIPWKGSREGMCGVLFDPIFSQRSAAQASSVEALLNDAGALLRSTLVQRGTLIHLAQYRFYQTSTLCASPMITVGTAGLQFRRID